ncbi:MAG: DUF2029 domain-containing protein, partial [Flavobacteriales bacterium]|nr:DUF2029 domain-containing protein [Flavobacteriales bacterium]
GATMMLLLRLLQAYKLPSGNIMFYAWNPLVIMEVVGNLHFEGLMLLGILGALYALHRKKQHWSGVAMGLAISAKLIPLMLVPAFFRYLGMRKWLLWSVVAGLVFVVTFLPFALGGFPASMLNSVDLYFRSFEFNASIFYLVRAIGFATVGYDIIQWSGPVLGVITAVTLLVLAFAKWGSSLPARMVVMLTCYYLLATTVHPWYIVTLVGLATLSGHAYVMVWSFLVLLSYSHYFGGGFKEYYWVIALEYALLLAAMVWNGKISRWIKMSYVNSGV